MLRPALRDESQKPDEVCCIPNLNQQNALSYAVFQQLCLQHITFAFSCSSVGHAKQTHLHIQSCCLYNYDTCTCTLFLQMKVCRVVDQSHLPHNALHLTSYCYILCRPLILSSAVKERCSSRQLEELPAKGEEEDVRWPQTTQTKARETSLVHVATYTSQCYYVFPICTCKSCGCL